MGYYNNNLYYEPESLGYTLVDELEFSDGCYQFDTLIVLEKEGKYFYAEDSGCSCPTPFEDVGEDDLTPITLEAWDDFKNHVEGRVNDEYSDLNVKDHYQEVLDKVYKGLGGALVPSYTSDEEKWGD